MKAVRMNKAKKKIEIMRYLKNKFPGVYPPKLVE